MASLLLVAMPLLLIASCFSESLRGPGCGDPHPGAGYPRTAACAPGRASLSAKVGHVENYRINPYNNICIQNNI